MSAHPLGDWDAAVVGGGPAGASAARELARGGARVVLLEQERPPRYKTCGGGLVGRALRRLPPEAAGVAERSFASVELRLLEPGLAFRVERGEPVVAMAMRAPLDHALLQAAGREGAELLSPCAVRGLRRASGRLELETERGTLRAGLVVAADGALSRTARAAGWHEPPAAIPALEWELEVGDETFERFGSAVRFDFGAVPDGYAWVFPKRAHLSVGLLRTRRGAGGLRSALEAWLARIGITDVRRAEPHGFVIPVRPRRRPARDGVLLAGDAAGLADPVTCEGISYALQSGELAARAALDADLDPDRTARLYRRRLGREVLGELRAARLLARMLYGAPRLRTRLFRAFGAALCEGMTEVILGRAGYRELLLRPANYGRLFSRRGGRRGGPSLR